MIVRDTPYPDGTPAWVELRAPDPRMAMDFYGALFGWSFFDQGDAAGNYLLCSLDEQLVAGLGGMPPDREVPAAWTTYLSVSDVEATMARAIDAGGTVLTGPAEVADAARFAVVADPTGAVFGLWEARRVIGAQLTGALSTLLWNECLTRDFAADRDFYSRVFGYAVNELESEEFTYATLSVGERIVGGLGELPREVPSEVPSHWMAYFGVADTDAAVHRVTELGGSVLSPPVDTPYGRTAAVADNQGVALALNTITAEPDAG